MKNSEKMDQNINFAVIFNKQDLFVTIPIYNERKKDTITASGFFRRNRCGPVASVDSKFK